MSGIVDCAVSVLITLTSYADMIDQSAKKGYTDKMVMSMILDIIPLYLVSKSDTSIRYIEQFMQSIKTYNPDILIPPKSPEIKENKSNAVDSILDLCDDIAVYETGCSHKYIPSKSLLSLDTVLIALSSVSMKRGQHVSSAIR